MAKIHGKLTFISLGGADLSPFCNAHDFDRKADSHDVTTYGKNAHVKAGGLLLGESSLGGWYDSTASTGPRAIIEPLIGTVVELVRRPEGTGAGKPEDAVDVLVTGYKESSPVADYVSFEVSMELSDDVVSAAQGA